MRLIEIISGPLLLQSLSLAFLAILFLQSGLDKIFDYQGNLTWIRGHFEKSPLYRISGLLVLLITVLETAAGIFSAIGLVILWIDGSIEWALIGAVLSGLSLLGLFFGQRLAKDYAGAAVLPAYFLVSLAAIYFLTEGAVGF